MIVALFFMLGLLFSGCRSSTISVPVRMPGEISLSNVGKLAVLDFNSIGNNADKGIFEADAETLSVVQGKVCAALASDGTYEITRLDAEKLIQDFSQGAGLSPEKRFDGIVYGSVWWQVSPELCGTYPTVFTLDRWLNVPYDVEIGGKYARHVTRVTTGTDDVLETLSFRSWNANLMLSLVLYQLDDNGKIEKLTETYAMATQKYLMNNGVFSEWQEKLRPPMETSSHGRFNDAFEQVIGPVRPELNGIFNTTKVTVSLPTELQAKLTLAESVASDLAQKIMPTFRMVGIEDKFCDSKISLLLKNGAYKSGAAYARETLNGRLLGLRSDVRPIVEKELKELNNAGYASDAPYDANVSKIALSENTRKYIADNIEYFYAEAVCNEVIGNTREALHGYRFVFYFAPSIECARGISRCLFALNKSHVLSK